MFITFLIVTLVGTLMFKLGALSVIVAVLALALKAVLFVYIGLAVLFAWRWFKYRRSQS